MKTFKRILFWSILIGILVFCWISTIIPISIELTKYVNLPYILIGIIFCVIWALIIINFYLFMFWLLD
jgi:hypothetical protein